MTSCNDTKDSNSSKLDLSKIKLKTTISQDELNLYFGITIKHEDTVDILLQLLSFSNISEKTTSHPLA